MVLLALLLIGCGSRKQVPGGGGDVATYETTAADAGWLDLMSGPELLTRREDESFTAFLLRQVEHDNRHLRERGLVFWHDYPEDRRRLDWLQMTVYMPPSYALDTFAWAEQELDPLSPNDTLVDVDKLTAWETQYAALRSEFWSDSSVQDVDRRFLWLGEIFQVVDRLEDRRARNEDVDTDEILKEIVGFYEAFPRPLTMSDSTRVLDTLFRVVFETHSEALNMTTARAETFLDALDATSSALSDKYDGLSRIDRMRNYLTANGRLPGFSVAGSFRGEAPATKAAWSAWEKYEMLRRFSPHSEASRIIHCHYSLVDRRKEQAIGWHLTDVFPSRRYERRWLIRISKDPRHYPVDPWKAALSCATDWQSVTEFDEDAYAKWVARYAEYRDSFLDDDAVVKDDRKALLMSEINSGFDQLPTLARLGRTDGVLKALEEDVYSLYVEFKETDFVRMELSNLSRKGVSQFGFETEEVRGVLQRFAHVEPEFRQILATFDRRAALVETPFELVAETMDGRPFNISSLHGQIVLVDHWNTSCSSCITAMPLVDNIRKEYTDHGFSVVSLAYDGSKKRSRVLRIKDELGLDDWISVNAEPIRDEMFERYDIWTFPQYMLLNRDGTLYAGTYEVDLGRNLAALLDEMLAAEGR